MPYQRKIFFYGVAYFSPEYGGLILLFKIVNLHMIDTLIIRYDN